MPIKKIFDINVIARIIICRPLSIREIGFVIESKNIYSTNCEGEKKHKSLYSYNKCYSNYDNNYASLSIDYLNTFITKYMILMKLDPNKTYIIERSPWTDYHCFAKLCHMSGNIDDMEMDIYKLYYQHFIKQLESKCAIQFIYLKTSSEICMERIKKRNRIEEKDIPIEYLNSLELLHNEWLLNNSIILNGNTDISDKTNIVTVEDFIKYQNCL